MITGAQIDHLAVLAERQALFIDCERAQMTNDVTALNDCFRDDGRVARHDIADW
jgi:hypothetical protein